MSTAAERFGGIDRLYGHGTLAVLARAHVCVIGIGGVGSWAAEALVRSGVGRLTLIDADDICVSNSNRQVMALEGNFGQNKVDVMAQRLRAINPSLQVDAVARYVTPATVGDLLPPGFDYVLDACDAFTVKVETIYWCRRNKIPIVTVGAAGGRTDPKQIVVRDLAKTQTDYFLAMIRRKLRDDFGWTRNPKRYFGVPAVFSTEQPRYLRDDGTTSCAKPETMEAGARLDCAGGLGAAMHVTASFAMVAVATLLERLLQRQIEPR